eukprot:gene12095-15204_t
MKIEWDAQRGEKKLLGVRQLYLSNKTMVREIWNKAPKIKEQLFEAVETTQYGAEVEAEEAVEIDNLIAQLEKCSGSRIPPASSINKLSGTWELCYTTEKSVHSIVNTLPVLSITQTIDIEIAYAFDAIYVEGFGGKLKLPFGPRGGGWTEASYIDTGCRVMQNSLGDTLLFKKLS